MSMNTDDQLKPNPTEAAPGLSAGATAAIIGALALMLVVWGAISRSGSGSSGPSKWDLIEAAKREVIQRAKDPGSVKFGDVWVGLLVTESAPKGVRVVCGHFNAKNGFGGYAGMQRFFGAPGLLMFDQDQRSLIDQAWNEACVIKRQV